MRTPLGITIIIGLMILVDFYVFSVIKSLAVSDSPRTKTIIYVIYWLICILTMAGLLLFFFTNREFLGRRIRLYLFSIVVIVFFSQLISSVFFLVDDLRRGIQWLAGKMFFSGTEGASMSDNTISRSVFLNWLGLSAGGLLMGSLFYGYTNKYNYQLKKVKLHFPNLPPGLKGMKIVQFSDVHSGSFTDKKAVLRGVKMIQDQHADLIVFTGDLVNDVATEMKNYMEVFNTLKAPMGVYSIFGNHDYGDYVTWPQNGITKDENLEHLAQIEGELGWDLLRNRNVILLRNGDKFPLIGVENWSNVGHFPKYGDLKKAYAGSENYPFKILLSHDPSHWDAQVRPEFSDIDLTLSGHTHGMQFGVKIPGFKWSPVEYIYKEWDGLYENGNQKLYVNPGYGFIGYPGRVGILPEITVFELV
ncbi:MAG: metallophosphoesterase [Chitinophagaceae bacterium]|nr:metallophosphoesterase [Chitinophagaceae bacterium]